MTVSDISWPEKKKKNLVPIDIVYEPSFDESVPVQSFFIDKIFFTNGSCIAKFNNISEEMSDFLREYLDDNYSSLQDIKEPVKDISTKKIPFKKSNFLHKILKFLYSHLIDIVATTKVNEIPTSQNVLLGIMNLIGIMKNEIFIHHSHITGDIIGYTHCYCNEKVRENYYKIPVKAQPFKVCFLLLLKGVKRGVWGTKT